MNGEMLSDAALLIDTSDNVATALDDLSAGQELEYGDQTITVRETIPFGHKLAVAELNAGSEIYKYSEVIGRATTDIKPGAWVHTHNCRSTRGRGDKNGSQNGECSA